MVDVSPRTKIVESYQLLKPIIRKLREENQKIVLTQGSFDMLHIGHGRYLERAKKHGDVLIVGVDSDEKIRARKGPSRPVVPEAERLEMLSYLQAVDYVLTKPQKAPKWQLIKIVSPDVLIATDGTYSKTQIRELEKICGQVVVLQPQATTSTSAKLRRLQLGFAKDFSQTVTDRVHQLIDEVMEEMKRV